VTPRLVDSHCHLQHFPPEERAGALDRARARGVTGFLVPAVRLDEAEELLRLCEAEPDVWCALGVHPHEAASWRGAADAARLRDLLEHPRAVAVGECGLDFHYDHAPRPVQEAAFRDQIEIAADLGLPIVVHNRESNSVMLALLEERGAAGPVADLHSFAGGAEMARRLLPLGHYFGVSGMVTFPKAGDVRAALAGLPDDRLLVETDTPYLAPAPYRGRRNEPAWVVEVAERLAAERGTTPAELARRTTDNFRRLFPRAVPAADPY
jgi:TatD DNase family protein